MAAISLAGENLIASLQSQGKFLVIDKLILANIPGLVPSAGVDRSQGMPSAGQIVSQEIITQVGVVEDNTIVYSQVLGSDIGTWSFNWLGLYCSEHDTLVAIAYEPLQEKRATAGDVIGNVITKNFAIEFNGASDLTGINISAESWQIDFSARLIAMDEIQRGVMHQVYGDITSLNSSLNVFYTGGKYFVTKGQAIVKGLLVELEQDLEINPPSFPCYVHVDVWQEKTMAGIINKVNFVALAVTDQSDYVNGPTQVYRAHYVDIPSAGVVGVQTQTQTTSFKLYHQGNMPEGSKTKKGIMQFASDGNSTSELEAISAKIFSEHEHDYSYVWNDIGEKPSTYPPSSHSHAWSGITDKPSTYLATSHSHAWSGITDKPSTFSPSAHSHAWDGITDKPSEYPPTEHSHQNRELHWERVFSYHTDTYEIDFDDIANMPDFCLVQIGWLQFNSTITTYSTFIYRKSSGTAHYISECLWTGYQATVGLAFNNANIMKLYRYTDAGSDPLKIRYIDIVKT